MRMITEAGYIELMKNCSKWNSRFRNESKRRLPYFDQQTATSHRSSPARRKSMKNRCPSDDPNYIVRYESMRWKKKNSSAPADTTELKFFAQQNPALAEALNAQAQSTQNTALVEQLQTENSVDSFSTPETRRGIQAKYEEFERDDDDTPSDAGSDGDDWGSKRKRRKGGPVKKKAGIKEMVAPKKETRRSAPAPAPAAPPVAAPSPPPRGHPCDSCSAKYKSRAGLIHHRAFWHNQFPNPNSPHPSKSISPSVDVSNFCDLCLGNRFKNRDGEAEDLVTCHDCGRSGHPSCLKFTPNMTFSTAKFGWQCIECKSCAICGTSENDDKLLFCDDCDRGFHIYCLNPPLKSAPENEWSCHMCQSQFGEKASAPTKP